MLHVRDEQAREAVPGLLVDVAEVARLGDPHRFDDLEPAHRIDRHGLLLSHVLARPDANVEFTP